MMRPLAPWLSRAARPSLVCALRALLASMLAATCVASGAQAQDAPAVASPAMAVTDTLAQPYPFDVFVASVRAHHPVARSAQLAAAQAGAAVRTARGVFDPTVRASLDRKRFGGTEYYDYASAVLEVPTWLGVDVKVGYERTTGQYISPDRRTPSGGLVVAGLSLPLGQRLLTDERRTAVAVARALRDVAEGDRVATVNRLLLGAARDYARWYEARRRVEVTREGEGLARFRLRAVRARVTNGDAAAIDTIEALVELQRRQVQRVEAEQAAFAAEVAVAAYLWTERGAPAELPPGASPAMPRRTDVPGIAEVAALVQRAERQHPDLQRVGARVEQALAQRRLAAQQVIPLASAELGSLADRDVNGGAPPLTADRDYKAGVALRTPLLFLKERGRLDGATLRLEQQRVDRARVRRDVANAVRIAVNDLATVQRLLDVQRVTVAQALLLRDGEQRRFENGESTLFLVNARERLVLDEQLRLASLEARTLAARVELAVSVGDAEALSR